MEFLNNLRTKSPVYLSIYEDLIIKFAAKQGGTHGSTSETQKFEQSKFFTNKYEIYMYAIILGIQKNYRLPLHDGSKKEKFWEINQWKPKELVDYIIMCLITISDINMNELEDMEEEEINQEIFKLRKFRTRGKL